MGQSGGDIILSPLAQDILPLAFECKNHKRFAIYSTFDQCKANTPEGHTPVVVIKGNYKEPLAVIPFDYYIQLEALRVKTEGND